MSQTDHSSVGGQSAATGVEPPLSEEEQWQLTLFKWRYALEARGFSQGEVRYLLFHKWRLSRLAGNH